MDELDKLVKQNNQTNLKFKILLFLSIAFIYLTLRSKDFSVFSFGLVSGILIIVTIRTWLQKNTLEQQILEKSPLMNIEQSKDITNDL